MDRGGTVSQKNLLRFLWVAGLSVVYFVAQPRVHADVELPLLNQVPKIISVSEQFPLEQLERFRGVQDTTIELRLIRGNVVPDEWVEFLNNRFPKVPKRVMVKGVLNSFHIGQIRKIKQVEVHYTVNPEGIDRQALNALFELGPIHKIVLLPENFTVESLDAVGKLKFFIQAFNVPAEFFSKAQLAALVRDKSHRKLFSLAADVEPKRIIELTGIKPIMLEIRTNHNQVPTSVLDVIKDLRGVELTIAVDGRLTQAEVKPLTKIDRFSLKVDLNDANEITPGLPQLLNKINPP
jgi:hypothetical protein